MDFVEQHEAEDFSNTRGGWPQVSGVGIVLLGGWADGECQITEELILIGEEGSVDRAVLLPSRMVKARGDTRAVGLVGDFLAALRQVRLARGILDVRSACRAFAHPVPAASA
jgi:hypothetical protein